MMHIQAGKNFKTSEMKFAIKLGPVVSTDSLWKDHSFPVVEVSDIFLVFPLIISLVFPLSCFFRREF